MSKIYCCEGKHFKVYSSDLGEVLEHPSEEEPVSVSFSHDDTDLIINVKGFAKRKMRIPKQKNRGDIYILQDQFEPLLKCLEELLRRSNIRSDQEEPWSFSSPQARNGRQSVPRLKKLAETSAVSLAAPFDEYAFHINNGYLIVDSEIPGRDQTKWSSEGAERQIHIGIFGRSNVSREKIHEAVVVNIPLRKLENNFLKPIQSNWID